ncbi:hypothetical protein M413DRAFT_30513 [Hebeloma cylindrosporum]|uniref:Uncharacterized protein n=1 Tax=Hebeloma cylindrosporum TaxID=76867 RepID=A0A0C3C2I9_HEBCY|nr:hypothetical protein M413DRAFT_30513 [Hebeloma cylindrosporum h7]
MSLMIRGPAYKHGQHSFPPSTTTTTSIAAAGLDERNTRPGQQISLYDEENIIGVVSWSRFFVLVLVLQDFQGSGESIDVQWSLSQRNQYTQAEFSTEGIEDTQAQVNWKFLAI